MGVRKAGIPIEYGPATEPWGVRRFYVRDPFGKLINILQHARLTFMSTLARLEAWYLRQCNGDWEHLYGVTIETLDNPGWSVTIDLTGTKLERVPCVSR